MEYEDYIKLKNANTNEEPLEVEINFFSSGASPDGSNAAWRCEIITHDNELWINREPKNQQSPRIPYLISPGFIFSLNMHGSP